MSGIHNNTVALDYAFLNSNLNTLLDEHIQKILICQPQLAELGQGGRVDNVILRAQAKKILEGHVVAAALYKVCIRHVVQHFEKQILEQNYRRFCHTAVIKAILLFQLIIYKRKVDKFVELSEKMVFGYEIVV